VAAGAVERIAHYRILKRVGRGGMGIVYRAEDERDGRAVALKVIREAEAPGDDGARHVNEARMRFTREAGILKSLLHVNVVAFYEIGEEDGTPWLAMEFLDGVPLTTFAGRPWTETAPLLIQAAHGLEYLSSRGIIHRDLSPDNVLVIERGGERLVKLLDFGIAKLFEKGTGLESLTATGFFLGKVAYGSPEQLGSLGHGAALDWRSDVYSLGVIFYQVLAGRRPFEGKAPVEYIAAHLNQAPPPVAAPPGVPPLPMDLVRLVGQMLEKRREDRPKSWREIVDRLVAALREAGAGAPRVSGEAPAAAPSGDPATSATALVGGGTLPPPGDTALSDHLFPRARLMAITALAGLFLVVAAALVVSWKNRLSGPPAPVAEAAARRPARAAPLALPPGELQVLAMPYARVLSIRDLATGKDVSVAENLTTPCVLPLAPGRYRVALSCPELGRTVEREIQVASAAPTLLSEPFLSPTALASTLR
jgi:serine/threonine-protein kinase